MEVISYAFDQEADCVITGAVRYTGRLRNKMEGTLRFEYHEHQKVKSMMEKQGVLSLDGHYVMTGFFITSMSYEYVDGDFVGTADFSFDAIRDRLDLL